ncbi:MAG: PEPxxWA-CTERM sorting domain-containing protein [Sandarakinorhabdus sp.]
MLLADGSRALSYFQGGNMRGKFAILAAAMLVSATAAAAAPAPIVLTFENIAPYPNNNDVSIEDYYNGGTSSIGTTGTNFGVSFANNALLICLNSTSVACSNASRGGLGDPASQQGGMFFFDGSETFLNVAAGFTTGFFFNYVSSVNGSVDVYDGLNGTGNLLTSVNLTPNDAGCGPYSAGFCPFGPAGASFAGTARSISFGGVAGSVVFDDVTFGSATPGPSAVPEPASWAMLIAGFGLIGATLRRRRAALAA